ncbi:hypothetical protein ACFY00_16265 [Kitasatospora sp. NPDC001540]|uniref:hypothetical protein n=1 Tax=Kitasatospora sp. NPDC001540 TaxID=3364014 RepID=UPI0036913A36
MNARLTVHLVVSLVLALVLVFTGAAIGGPALALLGLVLWYVLESLVKALLPPAFLPGVEDAQATSAVYRGWAAKLVAGTAPARTRTPAGDAARLAAGVPLCMLSFGVHDGSQTMGHLLLRRTPDGGTALAWRGRGKNAGTRPIDPPVPTFRPGREQLNPTQARLGYTSSVQFGGDTYWLRGHDAELLQLLLAPKTSGAPVTA